MTIWKLTLGAWFGVFDVFVVVSFFVCFFVLRLVGFLGGSGVLLVCCGFWVFFFLVFLVLFECCMPRCELTLPRAVRVPKGTRQ